MVFPGLAGPGTNWFSPSYHPGTQPGLRAGPRQLLADLHQARPQTPEPGKLFMGGTTPPRHRGGPEHHGVAKAIEAADREDPLGVSAARAAVGRGALDGGRAGLQRSNREGTFFALDARSGRPLWRFQTGGLIRFGPDGLPRRGGSSASRWPAAAGSMCLAWISR